jgi:hypothetical protein
VLYSPARLRHDVHPRASGTTFTRAPPARRRLQSGVPAWPAPSLDVSGFLDRPWLRSQFNIGDLATAEFGWEIASTNARAEDFTVTNFWLHAARHR